MNRHYVSHEKLEFSVGFASMDWSQSDKGILPNGCTYYRCMLPAQQLNIHGIHASFGFASLKSNGKFVIKRLNNTLSEKHKIIVLKVLMDIQILNAIPKAQSLGQKIVVDIDDLHEQLHETNHAFGATSSSNSKTNNRQIYEEIIKQSDALICSTPYIQEYYKQKHPDKPIFMVRNSIDIERWSRYRAAQRQPIIGWLGATPWRSLDLEQLAPFFENYLKSRNLKFHHAGHLPWAPAAYLRLGIDPKLCTVSPMVPLFELPTVYANFDVGIVPLNDIPFNRAKSFIKGLEYAAAGIPFVASDLPEYKYLSEFGVGRVASNQKQWESHLDTFSTIKERENESLKAHKIVTDNFTMKQSSQQWIDVFRAINKL